MIVLIRSLIEEGEVGGQDEDGRIMTPLLKPLNIINCDEVSF